MLFNVNIIYREKSEQKRFNKYLQEKNIIKDIYGVVITNSYFTQQAIKEANERSIILWDRDKLKKLIEEAKQINYILQRIKTNDRIY